jgi:hypothetical protein
MVALLAAIALAAAPDVILPGEAVGPLKRDTSEAALTRALGAPNVRAASISLGAGRCARGTVVFADDPARRIEIVWSSAAHDRPAFVVLGAGSRYRTPSGARVGASLAELERLKGEPLATSRWDWSGTVSLDGVELMVSDPQVQLRTNSDDADVAIGPLIPPTKPAVIAMRVWLGTLPQRFDSCE